MFDPSRIRPSVIEIGSPPWLERRFSRIASENGFFPIKSNLVFLDSGGLDRIVDTVEEGIAYGEEHTFLYPFYEHFTSLAQYLETLSTSLEKYTPDDKDFCPLDKNGSPFIVHGASFRAPFTNWRFRYGFPEEEGPRIYDVQNSQSRFLVSLFSFLEMFQRIERDLAFTDDQPQQGKDVHLLVYSEMKPGFTLDVWYKCTGVSITSDRADPHHHIFQVDQVQGCYPSRAEAVRAAKQRYKNKSCGVSFVGDDAEQFDEEHTILPLFVQRYLPKRLGL